MSSLKQRISDFFNRSETEEKYEKQAQKPLIRLVSATQDEQPANVVVLPTETKSANETHFQHVIVENSNDMPDIKKKLYSELGMAVGLHHQICPVLLDDEKKNTFALIIDDKKLNSDMVDSIINRLKKDGFVPASPLIYVAPFNIMIDLARQDIKSGSKQKSKQSGNNSKSVLWLLFEKAVRFSLQTSASDLHFEVDLTQHTSRIRFRIEGQMVKPKAFYVPTDELLDCLSHIYNNYGESVSEATFNQHKPQQCDIRILIDKQDLMFRYASTPNSRGMKAVMRMATIKHSGNVKSLPELGYLPDQVPLMEMAMNMPIGALVMAGSVGSGKTTTMQTNLINIGDDKALFTVEDPVENDIPGACSISVSRRMNDSDKDGEDPFVATKRSIKRLDPDLLFIGEIRDRQSAEMFEDAVKSGFQALTTIHASSVVELLTLRLVSKELGIPRDVIATPNFINLLVYQALVRTLCDCKLPAVEVYEKEYLDLIGELFQIDRTAIKAVNACGCDKCRKELVIDTDIFNGFGKRTVVAEMWWPDDQTLLYVREAKNIELRNYFYSMRKDPFDSPNTLGKTALEVAMYHVSQGNMDPKEVEKELGSFKRYKFMKESNKGTKHV